MTKQPELDFTRYPHVPGYRDTDTSRDAAESVKPTAASLRTKCLNVLRKCGPLTADEVAGLLNVTILSVRPRMTELRGLYKITDTGVRRKNASGHAAIVWGLV